jgi:hypothetical protein
MLALISFLVVVLFSLFVVRVGTIALEATGLSREIAKFQSQSAFTGVGFTTLESETIMNQALRRRVLSFLMLTGSAGLTSAIATLILTFMHGPQDKYIFNIRIGGLLFNLTVITLGLLVLLGFSRTNVFDKIVRWVLAKPMHLIKRRIALFDYEKILGLSKGYTIGSFEVPKHHWMVNKTIRQLEMEKEGVVILGVYRTIHGHEDFIGIPSPRFKIHNRDKIMVYCTENALAGLAKRERGKKGKVAREEAVEQEKEMHIIRKIEEEKLKKAARQSNS